MKCTAATTCALLLACCGAASASNPSLDVSQYAHTAWTVREGFSAGTAFAMTQTPDGYLWLGTEFGLFRFDGVRTVPWQPPAGQRLPAGPYSLLVTRDGTLWIGTYAGLVSWNSGKLTRYPEIGEHFVTSLLEDRQGTVWASTLERALGTPGRLCAIRGGSTRCYGQDGAFGSFVWTLYEDRSGNLWAGAESGLWRWKPGPPRRYATPGMQIADLIQADDGRLLIAMQSAGLKQLAGGKVEAYSIRSAINPNVVLPDHDVDSNKLLVDRDGGLWIGTHERGLIHVHHGRTDVFRKSDGLSGDIIAGLFQDREGNIWVSTSGGLDRFRELPVTTISAKQGLSSDLTHSVLAATDGSVWVATHDGLTRWQNERATIFRRANGLPDDLAQSLYQDDRQRIWVFTSHGLAYFNNGRFVSVPGIPSQEVYSITGDNAGNLWLSGNRGLSHLLEGRLIEHSPSSILRNREPRLILSDKGGLWLSFWSYQAGVEHVKDGQIRASYTVAHGLGGGVVANLRIDRDGALWAATEGGGLSRIKDGRIATLTARNGLPCNGIHWSMEDDDRSLWLYTACGLVRIARTEADAWLADPKHRIKTTVWDAADGVMHRGGPLYFGPAVAKSTDGKLWFETGEDIQVVDPRHLFFNQIPPPVHIEKIVADNKICWQNWNGAASSNVGLPPHTRDLQVDYTALSLAAPEKVHFQYQLEGYDDDWQDAGNRRQAFYTNLSPHNYRFRVIACNNSGVWNEIGDSLDFSVAPEYYQTNWFRALMAVVTVAALWGLYRLRLYQIAREFTAQTEERTRIARELHDTLLQSFQASLIQMGMARTLLSRQPEEAVEKLDEAMERAENAIAEGRDAIHDLRSSLPAHSNLPKLLTLTGQELATTQNADGKQPARFRATVEGEPRSMNPLIQDEAYRTGRELLRNAFQHANASEIEAEIQYEERLFRLRVRDDGRGIDPKILEAGSRAGHWGLLGMRERAKRIGGELKIWSQVGAGTEVELSIPSSVAYETGPNARRRLALFQRKRAQS